MQDRLCTGPVPRREFMRIGTLALGGLTLPNLLAQRAHAGTIADPDTTVILFWMWGGPSQFETWDMKPEAPAEIRGPLKPIPTTVPGMDICEYMPKQAQRAQRFSLIRSLHHEMSGETNARGEYPIRDRVTPQDLLATVYAHLGIDHTQSVKDLTGRPIPILPHASPIAQL